MSLTRKRRKALKRLRSSAEELWLDQQSILDRANHVAHEAKLQLGELTKEEVVPRVRTATSQGATVLARNVAAAKVAGEQARARFASDYLPAIGGALGSAAAAIGVSENPTVKSVLARTQPPAAKKAAHIGAYFAIAAGVVAAVGIGYAVWQTFRADDELWISEDELDTPPTA
ncbi:hypothetical protein KPL76_04655 [Subtercola sp. PAMC28395]|uniref:hypothetical protein n=1 Tax=Subtercola sp. PAMC28395 TaxID=2846775 RepID=UPI001C0C2B7B|nr:hypothetical protein [Subtercola sp. PAMC28395]QWT24673.1 hypothetical protein KPL76_04655 [Subtercola sp. PAMC28395]